MAAKPKVIWRGDGSFPRETSGATPVADAEVPSMGNRSGGPGRATGATVRVKPATDAVEQLTAPPVTFAQTLQVAPLDRLNRLVYLILEVSQTGLPKDEDHEHSEKHD
jgi:hypothetical protein